MIEKVNIILNELKETPFFKNLSQKHLDALAKVASVEYFQKGDQVIEEGGTADNFYAIASGGVNIVSTQLPNHEEPVVLQELKEHEILGWSWIIPPHQWRFDAFAVEETKALMFDGKQLKLIFLDDAHLGYELMHRFSFLLSMRLEITRLALMDLKHKYEVCVKLNEKLKKEIGKG